jgi:hypothetical protein
LALFGLLGPRPSLRLALGGALHGTIERFGPIRRVGVILAGFLGHSEDRFGLKPEIIAPASDMLAGRPALPPRWQCGVGGKAQRAEQLCKEPIKIALARSRALLLL